MALGALPREIFALILGSGARLAVIGVIAGIAGGIVATRLMTRLLYPVSASDPVIFTAPSVVLLAFALPACYIPAWRATRVDR
jgi:putative ABC transport system permease protein